MEQACSVAVPRLRRITCSITALTCRTKYIPCSSSCINLMDTVFLSTRTLHYDVWRCFDCDTVINIYWLFGQLLLTDARVDDRNWVAYCSYTGFHGDIHRGTAEKQHRGARSSLRGSNRKKAREGKTSRDQDSAQTRSARSAMLYAFLSY